MDGFKLYLEESRVTKSPGRSERLIAFNRQLQLLCEGESEYCAAHGLRSNLIQLHKRLSLQVHDHSQLSFFMSILEDNFNAFRKTNTEFIREILLRLEGEI